MILPLINVKLQNELYILIDIYEELIFLTLFLFLIGLSIIVLNQKNLIISLIGVEIVLLAANISFLATA
jgi:NADH:ubiquinone oxidoreductase subunit K